MCRQYLGQKENDKPLETIVLEVNKRSISYKNAKLVFSDLDCSLYFDRDANNIKDKLDEYEKRIDKNKLPLICVIGKGYFIGRCQPIVGNQKKLEFINDLSTAVNETYGDRVSIESKINLLNNNEKNLDNINNIDNMNEEYE